MRAPLLLELRQLSLVLSSLLFSLHAFGQEAALAVSGKTVAIQHCGSCHQVFDGQERPKPVVSGEDDPIIKAPTFSEIASRCQSDLELRTEISMPAYPMREQWLEVIEIDELVEYIASFAPTGNCPKR